MGKCKQHAQQNPKAAAAVAAKSEAVLTGMRAIANLQEGLCSMAPLSTA